MVTRTASPNPEIGCQGLLFGSCFKNSAKPGGQASCRAVFRVRRAPCGHGRRVWHRGRGGARPAVSARTARRGVITNSKYAPNNVCFLVARRQADMVFRARGAMAAHPPPFEGFLLGVILRLPFLGCSEGKLGNTHTFWRVPHLACQGVCQI